MDMLKLITKFFHRTPDGINYSGDRVSQTISFSQVHDQQLTHTAIITSIRGGSAGSSQQAAPFKRRHIFSDEIASGGGGGGGAGSSTFSGLSDTPANLENGKYLKVTNDGTGIEFVDALPGGGAGSSTLRRSF